MRNIYIGRNSCPYQKRINYPKLNKLKYQEFFLKIKQKFLAQNGDILNEGNYIIFLLTYGQFLSLFNCINLFINKNNN